MLHCPRCSGPLEVRRPHHDDPKCPAGDRCPHQRLQPNTSAANCLSGGGIILGGGEEGSQQSNLDSNLHQRQQCHHHHHHSESPATIVLLSSATPSAFCCAATTISQQQQQQQHFMLQPPLLFTSTIASQQQMPQLTFQQQPPHTTLCQPTTPAIVVGSSPFFASSMWPRTPVLPVSSLQEVLAANKAKLEQCNWYYPNLKWNESSDLLEQTLPGTFLVRDSADQRFLFSLSVQRKGEGPTSVRIHFQRGKFRLDAEDSIRDLMPEFTSVVELIDHYLASSNRQQEEEERPVWVDNIGKLSSPICLRQPLYKSVPSLKHFSRLVVSRRLHTNKATQRTSELGLPNKLVMFIEQYPHRA